MKRITITTAVVAALAALGCDPTATTEIDAPQFRKGPVIESVTGSGHFTDSNGNIRTFTMSAKRLSDGSVIGQWERVNHLGGGSEAAAKSHGVVTCFTNIDGDSVLMGGYATSGAFSTPPNNEVRWQVADNGPGGTDQNSLQWVGGSPGRAAKWCALGGKDSPKQDLTAGNITVRP